LLRNSFPSRQWHFYFGKRVTFLLWFDNFFWDCLLSETIFYKNVQVDIFLYNSNRINFFMNLLLLFIWMYLLASIAIGIYAARRVHGSTDYVLAWRSLPIYIATATVFATWFGSETVLWTSSTFLSDGLSGIVSDPFWASLCLILVGLFFAKPLYQKNFLTIGDFYREKYGREVEVIAAICIIISYLGWVSAQIIALWVVFHAITSGAMSIDMGMILWASIVLIYTLFGGMWSIALTDFFQMMIIVVGMIVVGYYVTGLLPDNGNVFTVIEHAKNAGKLEFFPDFKVEDAINYAGILWFISAMLTMGFWSIPQQDVFQRVMSSKNVTTAQNSAILGGSLYFVIAFIPVFLAYSASLIDPKMVEMALAEGGDTQLVLPNLILQHTPVFVQIIFFGALLSAIMSTASGTLLAPSTMFVENLIKPMFQKFSDEVFLKIIRVTVAIFTVIVTLFALNSNMSIFAMVENAYKITLVGAFVPLVFGIYWKRANPLWALLAMVLGIVSWVAMETTNPEGIFPPQLVGLCFSTLGMLLWGFVPWLFKLKLRSTSSSK